MRKLARRIAVPTGPLTLVLSACGGGQDASEGTRTTSDTSGRPLSGTVDIQFVFNGTVVGRDRPPTHPISAGRWLAVRAVVHTSRGSATLDWPIQVKR